MSEHGHDHASHGHDHGRSAVVRYCDVAVVGGSAAGLAAALQMGRQRRSVIVVDSGEPRNAPAAAMHGYLGHEGVPPSRLTTLGRDEVRGYGGEVLTGRATGVTRDDGGAFRVALAGGDSIVARRVLAATGLVDELPAIDGLAAHWGRDVVHCPFCHGYEVRDTHIAQVVTHRAGLHPAALFASLAAEHTLVLDDAAGVEDAEVADLRAGGTRIVRGRAVRVHADDAGRLTGLELADGQRVAADTVAVGPRFHARAEALAPLGLRTVEHVSGLGDAVPVDATGQTPVPGLYAAGNVTDPSHQVLSAAADGSRVGAMICFDLAREDLVGPARTPAAEADWDRRYSGDRLWSGNPNGTLVAEVQDLAPGRALDVGAGEGGDALWLAARGWTVTATDISRGALGVIDTEAQRRGLAVECRYADANAVDPFAGASFDLVSAQYASVPRTPDDRAVGHLLAAVAPGGTLLVVSHDLAPMRAPVDPATGGRPFDPEAYVRVDDVAAALAGHPDFVVERHETRPRPPGAVSASHHVDDVVLRARRRG